MSDTKQISFPIGELTKDIVDRIAEEREDYNSATEFYEICARTNGHSLKKLAVGGRQARTLVKLLDEIEGVTVSIPEDQSTSFILGDDLSSTRPTIELQSSHLQTYSKLHLETGLSRSEHIRRAILRQLSHLNDCSNLLLRWEITQIDSTWEEVEAGLKRPRLQCFDVLQRRFVDELEATERKIAADPTGFERFADQYANQFYRSDGYQQLIETRDERPFTNIENLIQEYSEYSDISFLDVSRDHSDAKKEGTHE